MFVTCDVTHDHSTATSYVADRAPVSMYLRDVASRTLYEKLRFKIRLLMKRVESNTDKPFYICGDADITEEIQQVIAFIPTIHTNHLFPSSRRFKIGISRKIYGPG